LKAEKNKERQETAAKQKIEVVELQQAKKRSTARKTGVRIATLQQQCF
jgi:hypothetical protein